MGEKEGEGQAVRIFLFTAGTMLVLIGVGVLGASKSAIHEILACIAGGFGVVSFGLAGVIGAIERRGGG